MRQEPSATLAPATRRHGAPSALVVAIVLWFSATASAPAEPFHHAASAADPYAEAVLADQPAMFLRLDEGAGPFAFDSSGHGEDGTYQSGVGYGTPGAVLTDPAHTAVTWTGGGNGPVTAVTQSGTTLPAGNAARTVEFWWRLRSNCNALPAVGYGGSAADGQFTAMLVQCSVPNGISRGLNLLTGGQTFSWPLPASWTDGAWHLFDVTYDGATATGYMDGQVVGSSPVPTQLATVTPGNGFRVSDQQTDSCCSTDDIDEVAAYPAALSPARIGAHWTAGASTSGPCPAPPRDAYGQAVVSDAPRTYLRLGDLAGDAADRVAFDSSGNCTAAAPTNGALMTGTTAQPHGALQGYGGGATAWRGGRNAPVTAVTQSGDALPSGNKPRTVEFWWRLHSNCNALPTVGYGGAGADGRFTVMLVQCSVPGATGRGLNLLTGGQSVTWPLPAAWTDGAWHLFDVSYDGTNATAYMDGQVVGSRAVSPLSTTTPGDGLSVSDRQTDSCCSDEDIQEVAIYPAAIAPARIDAHWSAAASASGPCAAPPADAYGQSVVGDAPEMYLRLGDLLSDPSDRVAFDSSGHCTAAATTNGALMTGAAAQPDGALPAYPGGGIGWRGGGNAPVTAVIQSGATLPSGDAPRTVEFWWRLRSNCNALPTVTYGGPGTDGRFTVTLAQCSVPNGIDRGLNLMTGDHIFTWPLPAAWTDGRWHQFDVTYDGTTAIGYMDGQVVGSSPVATHLATVTPGEGFRVGDQQTDSCCSPDDIQEVAVYPVALPSQRILAHWKAQFSTPPGKSIIAGSATDGHGAGVAGARAQACPASGGTCTVEDYVTTSSGSFHMLVPDGTYTVTIFPPPGSPSGQLSIANVKVPPNALSLTATFAPPGGLPSGATLATPGASQRDVVPAINWGSPSTYTVTGACAGGAGLLSLGGTNTSTGRPETVSAPLFETPPGSGTYQAAIPPLAPMHGVASVTDVIDCQPQRGLFPTGGPPGGGTDVLLNANGGLTGATAVKFGAQPAASFTVLTDDFITATAPPGTGNVPVTVTAHDGSTISIGTYTYLAVASLSDGSGPAHGGTTLTITGQGFQQGDQVLFGLVPAQSVTYVSPTQLQVVAPPGAGTVNVQVVDGYSLSAPSGGGRFSYTGGPSGTAGLDQTATSPQAYAQEVSEACEDTPLPETDPQLCGAAQFALDVFDEGSEELIDQAFEPIDKWAGDELRRVAAFGVADLLDSFEAGKLVYNLIPVVGELWDIYQGAKFMVDVGNDVCNILVGTNCRWDFWNLFIDPSGTVVDTNGNPISGATATLLSRRSTADPFAPVDPAGGSIEPAANPETTGSTGAFHWDALAGTYEVEASAPGCSAPGDPSQPDVFTSPFAIPPPAVGLVLQLRCSGSPAPPTPDVTSVAPGGGPEGGGNTVDIIGTGLANATAVHFGDTAATQLQVLSPYAIAAVAPAGTGTVDVTVTTAGGTSAKAGDDRYAYAAPHAAPDGPTISDVSPGSGPLSGGTAVTITGRNLDGAYAVEFGGVRSAQVTDVSATEVRAVAPAVQFPVRVDIAVTTSAGTSTPTAADRFAYGTPPSALATTVSATASPSSATPGRRVTLEAKVSPTDGGGSVAFSDDGATAPISGCGAVALSRDAAGYSATCATSDLPPGDHTIIAAYSGDAGYAAGRGTTVVSIVGVPVSSSPPSIAGVATQGQTLTETHGAWTPDPSGYHYQWQDCDPSGDACRDVLGATSETYVLSASDVGHTVRVEESATNAAGTGAPARSAATATVRTPGQATPPVSSSAPAISGRTTAGRSLSASPGAWSGATPMTFAYRWEICRPQCSGIPATAGSYTLAGPDVGARIRVVVTATNGAGRATASSPEVGPVAPSAAGVRAALAKVLRPRGTAARIRSLLRRRGYTFVFAAPCAGTLTIRWRLAHRRSLVATLSIALHKGGRADIALPLTRKGRTLLAHAANVELGVQAGFTPAGGTRTTARATFRLRR